MTKKVFISVTAQDHIGIIANITNTIKELNGDLFHLNQTVLDDYFTMTLIAEFPDNTIPNYIETKITDNFYKLVVTDKFKVIVWENIETGKKIKSSTPESKYILTVSSHNRKGIVADVSEFCYKHKINIDFLDSHLVNDEYTMIFHLDTSKSACIKSIRTDLTNFSKIKNLKAMLQHEEIFHTTSEV